MNKKLIIGISVGIVILAGAFLVITDSPILPGRDTQESPVAVPKPRDATYTINGETVPLKDGEAVVQVDTGVFVKYKYFQHADGDLNDDDVLDSAVIIVGDAGGSGTFYYVAALESTPSGWKGTDAILLGDRIAPQTIDVFKSRFVVNYMTRKPGESFAVAPSVGVSRYFQAREGVLVEIGLK